MHGRRHLNIGVFAARGAHMIKLLPGLSYVDLRFQGVERVIATVVLDGPGGVALVDPGPSSALPALRSALDDAGIRVPDLTAILLTHIHLDHAGATGTLAGENSRLHVYVHEKGAPHLVEPERLLKSAARLYGDAMASLFGEMRPVPAGLIVALQGGERVIAGGRGLDVAYTPGHASHHVSFFDPGHALALVGDTAGIKLTPEGEIVPPTPPPDFDLDAWHASLSRIGQWQPETLFLTHFGPSVSVGPHLKTIGDRLDLAVRLARDSLVREGSDADRARWFGDHLRQEIGRRPSEAEGRAEELAASFDLSWLGLARYCRKRGAAR